MHIIHDTSIKRNGDALNNTGASAGTLFIPTLTQLCPHPKVHVCIAVVYPIGTTGLPIGISRPRQIGGTLTCSSATDRLLLKSKSPSCGRWIAPRWTTNMASSYGIRYRQREKSWIRLVAGQYNDEPARMLKMQRYINKRSTVLFRI
jgi:hypothetical protein